MSRGHSKLCFHLSMVMSVLILSMLSPAQKTQTPGTSTLNDEELLLLIKQKTGGYCERLKAVALHFVCHENMHENVYNYGKRSTYSRSNLTGEMIYATQLQLRNVKEKTYVYDYQMVRDGEKKQEQRTLIQENGKKKNKKDANLQLQRYYAQYLVYGPVGFFSFSWQPEFEYALLGRERLNSTSCLVVTAVPSHRREENYSFGKIWVDAEDFSILKIEWDPRSIPGYTEEVDSSIGSLKREIRWSVTYGKEKNGIRFPSHQMMDEILISQTGKRQPKYTLNIIYSNYQFFIVETEIKY